MKKLIFLLIPILFFIGCANRTPEYKIVYKEKITLVKPPKYLLTDNIEIPSPPSKFSYVTATPFNRERMLVNYTLDLLGTIKKYKSKIKEMNNWYKKTNKIITQETN